MKENISSPELTLNIWSNDACRGYVIAAMERCGFKPADIDRMMQELHEVFDSLTLDEAQRLYERSTY